MRHTLLDDPRVGAIARSLKVDQDFVIGKLFRVWTYADRHTQDGIIHFTDDDHFDEKIAMFDGMAEAMRQVGWLADSGNGLALPHFAEHNGVTAKARACTRKRVQAFRSKSNQTTKIDRNGSPLPEKRREENKIPPSSAPPPGPECYSTEEKERFKIVWDIYPNKDRYLWALAVFTQMAPDDKAIAEMVASINKRRATPKWQERNGKWVPLLENWLAGKRWLDDSPVSDSRVKAIVSQRSANAQEKASAVPLSTLSEALKGIKRA